MLGAITIYVLLRKWMNKLLDKGWNADLAAIFLMSLSFICILVPVAGIVAMLSNKVEYAVENSEEVINVVKAQIDKFERNYNFDLSSNINTSEVSSWLSENLESFAGGTFNIFIATGLMYFMLYYMLSNRKQLRESLYEYIPISKPNLKIIGEEIQHMVRSNAIGIPLVAIA